MKRFLTLVLCITMLCSFMPPVFAENTQDVQYDKRADILCDLGLLQNYEPESHVTRQMLSDALENLYAYNTYDSYLERRDMAQPVLYGQMLMIAVDLTGYTPFIGLNNLDINDPASYKTVATKAGFNLTSKAGYQDAITMKDYVEIMYEAIFEVNLLSQKLTNSSDAEYYIDKNATIANTILGVAEAEGILTGADNVSFNGDAYGKGYAAIDGVWAKTSFDKDISGYIGMNVIYLYNKDEKTIMSIVPDVDKNEVLEVISENVVKSKTTTLRFTYENENGKEKVQKIHEEADLIYNGRLYESFPVSHLRKDDCTYKLIDNNGDKKADVIIAEKYDTFMAETIISADNKIVDKNNNVYDLTEYFDNYGKIYNESGREISLDGISNNNIVSYLKAETNEYTKFVVSSKTEDGIFTEMSEAYRYIYISGNKFETAEQYYSNYLSYDKISVGDEIKAYFDFKGYIVDIKRIASSHKAGYLVEDNTISKNRPVYKMLKEDGKIYDVNLASKVKLDGVSKAAKDVVDNAKFKTAGEFVPQLVLYKENKNGEIYWIDTADNNSNVGKTSDGSAFTMDYDYNTESALRIITFNGTKVLGSKYVPNDTTLVFGVSTELDECYVNNGASLGTGTSYNIKLYNVDEDYVPMYAVLEITPKLGDWVDWSNKTYILDDVTMVYDEEQDDEFYKFTYYDGKNTLLTALLRSGDLITPNGNVVSGDTTLRTVKAKDLPRGTVFQVNQDKLGIRSVAVQAIPKMDNSEKIFEWGRNVKFGDTSGSYEQGISHYMFNDSQVYSYGKVVKRVPAGIVVNNHTLTATEIALGQTDENWNRIYPITAADNVWIYDKQKDELKYVPSTEIIAGDMIFMHRASGTITTTIIYR